MLAYRYMPIDYFCSVSYIIRLVYTLAVPPHWQRISTLQSGISPKLLRKAVYYTSCTWLLTVRNPTNGHNG